MFADKALILLGSITFLVNLFTMLSIIYDRKKTLLLIVYIDLVCIVYLLIYALGCITFKPNMQ